MTDLFADKAQDFDTMDVPQQLSAGIGRTILERVELRPDMRVMDFGAGTGLLTSHVAPRVGRVTAVDVSASMLERLAAKEELRDRVEVVCQDILDCPLDLRFDLIVSAMAMHHVEDTAQLLARFWDHLEPGARVALADLDAEDGDFHPADIQGVYHAGFERPHVQSLLEAQGFVDIELVTAVTVRKNDKPYPVFLATATRP